jgi:beta-glucosidase
MKYLLSVGVLFFLYTQNSSAQSVALSPLDKRLDDIISKMSIQEKVEQLYYKTDGNERLNIPQFMGSDGPHGIGNKAKGYSSFPVTIAMAASWDQPLTLRVGRAISLEQAARKKHRIAGPTLDILSDPRNGRAPETVGEDPFLGGRISESFILGQNTTAVFGSVKHYNLNTYEANREKNNYLIDQRSLVEFWSMHWKRAVQDGGAMSIMCGYNLVNSEKSAENYNLIKTLLRDTWGFNYYTMSDWGGFWSTQKAINAELDFCEGNDLYFNELAGLVKNGTVDEALLNKAVKNILRTKILSGMIDGQPIVDKSIIDGKVNRELVYESGLKSLVLLKNKDQILPLPKKGITVALIGPNANNLPLDGHSSSAVVPSYTITLKNALDSLLGAKNVKYIEGCKINSKDNSQFAEAKEIAKNADYVIFAGGLDGTVEGEGYFIGGDRLTGSTVLPGVQSDLINELATVNQNIVLTIISGGVCSVNNVLDNLKGLVYAFYPGQEGGRAIADVLLGNYNPSGKLPATIPKNDAQLPSTDMDFTNALVNGFGYRWYDYQKLKPEFPFGFGLSYTSFEYSDIKIYPAKPQIGDEVTITFNLKNTGKIAGEEVAQLYLSTLKSGLNLQMPVKELKDFGKVNLASGESKKMVFRLTADEFYVFNDGYKVPTSSYQVMVGGSSDNLPLKANFEMINAQLNPDLIVKNIRTMPAFPKVGEEVTFLVSVLNRGTASVQNDQNTKVDFYVDGKKVAVYSGSLAIPVGGMELICASPLNGKTIWKADANRHNITAKIDGENNIKETNEKNNVAVGVLDNLHGRVIPKEDYALINK